MTQPKQRAPRSDRGFTLGLVIGTLFGASIGSLLAPQGGTDRGGQLAFQAERLRRRLRELRETLPDVEPSAK